MGLQYEERQVSCGHCSQRSTGGSETSGSIHIANHAMVADFKGTI